MAVQFVGYYLYKCRFEGSRDVDYSTKACVWAYAMQLQGFEKFRAHSERILFGEKST